MTRPLVSAATPLLRRGVTHHARPPRMPALRSPHVPSQPRQSAGTSTPNPAAEVPTTSSSKLGGSGLSFHHSPPPTAPSYTTGRKPDLLRWISGEGVQLTGEEAAPLRRAPRAHAPVEWSSEVVAQMKEMRAEGKSRGQIAEALSIPPEHQHVIPRVAPASKAQLADKAEALERQQDKWSPARKLSSAVRERRKLFW
ncbi:uncharacterized protein CcaverHIS019_0108080 [Cutaneotrichosporon cavernicola]|uniref:Uncharacterized protein n=1 Tax=Cutaneotrichosporon cavernicola TaxID=279322 RepID=A0AA48I579_9TREE|nr:uncharacterized protein CcaverHIS019_0108080 [Cutaneotrichosporon cavernicola]BEI88090.1 hypothetical protein CcaverHIS019_0108080 [Cutaneotrichosporon cavernicola]BEI95861.1 hypothetical protein CcaverHIS631_0108100 [Cutaneotrichosporon cavernicola]BEJ03635.1 hypothetical protein CcaverHIS641_0108100 [Cutaneotrichosporon cavernicola]